LLYDCLKYIIENDIKTRGEYQLTDALQLMLEHGEKMITFDVEDWYDCGTPEALLQTNRNLLKRNHDNIKLPGNIIIEPVLISKSASIKDSIIGPYVSIADGVSISKSIIEDTIVDKNASIRNALISGSIIGDNAVFEGQFNKLNISDYSQITYGQNL
jgi:glucose-1-phosphate thymidylyltransferase